MITKHDIKYMSKCFFYKLFSFGYKSFGYRSAIVSPLILRNKKYISVGSHVIIFEGARIECFDKYISNYKPLLEIGDNVTIGYNFQCLVASKCVIGHDTLMASNILISTENHGTIPDIIYSKQPLITKDVYIGNNCWIGEKVIILPGVTLGDNVIVAAGSIVTKSFDSNQIIAGNPAKVIKKYNLKDRRWENIK